MPSCLIASRECLNFCQQDDAMIFHTQVKKCFLSDSDSSDMFDILHLRGKKKVSIHSSSWQSCVQPEAQFWSISCSMKSTILLRFATVSFCLQPTLLTPYCLGFWSRLSTFQFVVVPGFLPFFSPILL